MFDFCTFPDCIQLLVISVKSRWLEQKYVLVSLLRHGNSMGLLLLFKDGWSKENLEKSGETKGLREK